MKNGAKQKRNKTKETNQKKWQKEIKHQRKILRKKIQRQIRSMKERKWGKIKTKIDNKKTQR